MRFEGRHRRRPNNPRAAAAAAVIIAVAAALNGVLVSSRVRGRHVGGDVGSTWTFLIFGVAIVLPLVVFRIARAIRGGSDDNGPGGDDAGTSTDSTSASDASCDDPAPRVLVIAIIGALLVIGVGLFAWTQKARAQGVPERGALYIRRGADTVVTDRFSRDGDTLRGSSQVKGRPAVDYVAVLGAGDTLRTLSYDIHGPTAKPGDAPATHLFFTMRADTAVAETPSGVQRVVTKPGAIPMMNNMLALMELFTRRAKAAGGALDMPWLAVAGGATIVVRAAAIGPDSMSLRIGAQEQRFHIDGAGRILGGSIPGANLEYARGGPGTAGAIPHVPATASAPPPDYSAPAGAPYTAEEVRVAGPGGITLGGTLTEPVHARRRLPAVVTITGSGQQDRDEYIPLAGGVRLFRQLADTLSRRGMAVLRLDDRGLGASGGDARLATSADFADDIRAAVAWLRARADIDPDRIALAGHSEGGMIAPMIAATDPRIRAIVTLAGPAVKGIEISMAQNAYLLDQNPSLAPARRDSILRAARAALLRDTVPWIRFFMAYDPAPVLRKVKAATLVLQGATDRQVPAAQAGLLASYVRAGGNRDVTVRIFPATDHLFLADSSGNPGRYGDLASNKVRPEVLGAAADWLASKLGAR